ncbi:SURF1 family protein [Pleionea sediminis]|uniref:SURF1 family protein n=1 Tax=Pleionea sediminis TaxID=2569479 RepID=UPI001184B660|nr:SURF1 family protein [Pleionea sediminis]
MIRHFEKLTITSSLPGTQRVLKLNFVFLLALVVFEYLFFSLGTWQLNRAEEKKELLEHYKVQQLKPPVELNQSNFSVQDYQPVTFSGSPFSDITVYIANEPFNGRDGYHILTPVKLLSGNIVWVNRGWVEALPDRRYLPDVKSAPEQWEDQGYAYFSKGQPILFDNAIAEIKQNQWVIQGRDNKLLSTILGTMNTRALPYIIRLSPKSPHGFTREWRIVSMSENKHIAYAVQWFGLAVALMIIFVVLSVKRKEKL